MRLIAVAAAATGLLGPIAGMPAPGTPAPPAEAPALAPPDCGPGSRPAPGIDGRVIGGPESANGYTCNAVELGHEGVSGGYKVERYADKAGHVCAYYDTTLLFPLNAASATLDAKPTGTAVLDVSDPTHPVRTATLVTPAMQSPHESLLLNEKRGLLAAVMGTPVTAPGFVDVYELEPDCRHPRLASSLPVGLLGHESGWTLDGKTFYATSIGTGQVTAVDMTHPHAPLPLWVGHYDSHGLTLSDDGKTAYIALRRVGLLILDVSEIQERKRNPKVHEISRLTWPELTIPQVAIPVTIRGRPYLVEMDEFSNDDGDANHRVTQNGPIVGAARIIDISDVREPRVVSNIRLAVHQRANRAAIADDPGASSPIQGYAGHYCNVPRERDPGIVACSFIASGLRVFDIRNPSRPREVAYFVAPPAASAGLRSGGPQSDWAMSKPAFDPADDEVWYSDGNSGFYTVKLTNGVWPK